MAAADAEPLSPARDRVPAADHALAAAARELLGQGQGLEAAAMLGAALEGAADLARTWLLNDIALCAMHSASADEAVQILDGALCLLPSAPGSAPPAVARLRCQLLLNKCDLLPSKLARTGHMGAWRKEAA